MINKFKLKIKCVYVYIKIKLSTNQKLFKKIIFNNYT